MFACLFPCFISMLASLDLGFAMLCTLHGFMLVWLLPSLLGLVWMWPFMRYNPSCWCAWYAPFSAPCDVDMLALLALHHPFGFLHFFASFTHLPTCSCMSLCFVHTPIQWNHGRSIQTNICPPRTPPLFNNMLRSPLCVFHMLVCPYLASLLSLSLACFYFHLFLFLSAGLSLLSLHVHTWGKDVWSKGETS